MEPSIFERLGGEPVLREIIEDFVERCYADLMIGFLFARADKERLKEMEYQHANEHLGGNVQYSGRALDDAHKAHRILGGQFDRRKQILKDVLHDHQVPQPIQEAWLRHQDSLRHLITKDPDSNCRD